MYQASHLQSCQVPAHMNRQLVGGKQAGSSSSSSTRNGPSYLGSIFFLPRSLSYTHTFYPSLCSSSFLVLSPPLWSTPVMLNHPHTHSYYTHTWSSTPSLSLSPFFLLFFNDSMHECRWPLWKQAACHWAIPGLVDFTVVLIQQLLSSMATVKETARHQCTAALLLPLLLFPCLSPMWHKGLSYTPPLLRLCQEPSSVRLLLYSMCEIHLAPHIRWSVKRESPFILQWVAECIGDAFAAAFSSVVLN